MTMALPGQNNGSQPSTSSDENSEGLSQITCHLVSLPSIVLTRCDEGNPLSKNKTFKKKTPIKKLNEKPSKLNPVKNSPSLDNGIVKRGRGRPKNSTKEMALSKLNKNSLSKLKSKNKRVASNNSLKIAVKTEKSTGRMLKKTILQKRSKIVIPSAKNTKINKEKPNKNESLLNKQTKKPANQNKQILPKKPANQNKQILPKQPVHNKQTPPKPKLTVLPSKQSQSDSSEDDFLYDELIEELENSANKRLGSRISNTEKTTNITLKPTTGNKPPIIVKGGIVKRVDLPADLKSIANPNENTGKSSNGLYKPKSPVTPARTTKRVSDTTDYPGPAKKASPWPVAISKSSKKPPFKSSPKIQKPASAQSVMKEPQRQATKSNEPAVLPEETSYSASKSMVVKPKIGPKQTAKVVPLSKSLESDGNVSDEYLEEETLESDLDLIEVPAKAQTVCSVSRPSPKAPSSRPTVNSKDDDDPNLDLLRILTDDSDELPTIPVTKELVSETKTPVTEKTDVSREKDEPNCDLTKGKEDQKSSVTPNFDTADEVAPEVEEPRVRTIYDLISEVSLQYPSWNLHIIPETTAFCIAQVTKGRLGLPTLKKCIELDPVTYNAKVYIHQYHIKRFDGVYDSEESILALIHEINNIKA